MAIQKNYSHQKQTSKQPVVIQYLYTVHSTAELKQQQQHRGEDFMKKFCRDLTEHTMEIIDSEKMERKSLTDEWNDSYTNQTICCICIQEFEDDDDKKIIKFEIIVIT